MQTARRRERDSVGRSCGPETTVAPSGDRTRKESHWVQYRDHFRAAGRVEEYVNLLLDGTSSSAGTVLLAAALDERRTHSLTRQHAIFLPKVLDSPVLGLPDPRRTPPTARVGPEPAGKNQPR